MKTLANKVIDFTASYDANKPPFKAVIDPSSPAIGAPFKVIIYAPESYTLLSPYNGIISGKTLETAENKEEIVSLGSLSTEYPINTLSSVNATNAICDKDIRETVISAGADIDDSITVVNCVLKSAYPESYVGSFNADYLTHTLQTWQHSGFDFAGNVMLFAQNDVDLHWEEIPVTIAESSNTSQINASIEIMPIDKPRSYYGITGGAYLAFAVLGADSPAVKTNHGTIEYIGLGEIDIKVEQITLDGSGMASAKWYINELDSYVGLFKNKDGDLIESSVFVSSGKLNYTVGVFGSVSINYKAKCLEYDYYSEVQTVPFFKETLGIIIAQEGENSTSYEVPLRSFTSANDIKVCLEVVYKVVASPHGLFEYPPSYSSNPPVVTYPYYIFPSDALLDRYPYPVQEIIVETAISDGVSVYLSLQGDISVKLPFSVIYTTWAGRVYSIKKTMPENANVELQDEINAMELQLKTKYNIS